MASLVIVPPFALAAVCAAIHSGVPIFESSHAEALRPDGGVVADAPPSADSCDPVRRPDTACAAPGSPCVAARAARAPALEHGVLRLAGERRVKGSARPSSSRPGQRVLEEAEELVDVLPRPRRGAYDSTRSTPCATATASAPAGATRAANGDEHLEPRGRESEQRRGGRLATSFDGKSASPVPPPRSRSRPPKRPFFRRERRGTRLAMGSSSAHATRARRSRPGRPARTSRRGNPSRRAPARRARGRGARRGRRRAPRGPAA